MHRCCSLRHQHTSTAGMLPFTFVFVFESQTKQSKGSKQEAKVSGDAELEARGLAHEQ